MAKYNMPKGNMEKRNITKTSQTSAGKKAHAHSIRRKGRLTGYNFTDRGLTEKTKQDKRI